MNCSTLFCQLFIIVVPYVFCNPVDDDEYKHCIELQNVECDFFNPILDELEKYICYNEPLIDYNILHENVNWTNDDDNEEDKWINCVWFKKTQIKVFFLHDKKMTAFVNVEDISDENEDWRLIEFEFKQSTDVNTIYDMTEIRDKQQEVNKNDVIALQKLQTGEGNSVSLNILSFYVKIYSETFDPEPNNFDGEIITIIIIRSPEDDVTHLVLSQGEFWISKVIYNYITLFIEKYENTPYVITFADNSAAKKYRKIIIEWARQDKLDVPFPDNILSLLLH